MPTIDQLPEDGVLPIATAKVTFLPISDGGRSQMPQLTGTYRPHIVFSNHTSTSGELRLDLGVQFVEGTNSGELGQSYECKIAFMYHDRIDYTDAKPNATFRIHEGSRIVGFGEIISVVFPN